MWTDDLFKGYITVRYSGADLTPRRTIEFVGATVADDSTNGRTVVTIPSQWPEGLIGSMLYHNGSAWVELQAGDAGDVLTLGVAGPSPVPTWAAPSAGLPTGPSNVLFVDMDGDDDTAVRGDSSHPYATIQAALDDAQSGDVVRVGPGTFAERVTLSELAKVSLIGSGMGVTKISFGDGDGEPTLILAPASVALTDCLIADLSVECTNTYAISASGSAAGITRLRLQNVQGYTDTSHGSEFARVDELSISDCDLDALWIGGCPSVHADGVRCDEGAVVQWTDADTTHWSGGSNTASFTGCGIDGLDVLGGANVVANGSSVGATTVELGSESTAQGTLVATGSALGGVIVDGIPAVADVVSLRCCSLIGIASTNENAGPGAPRLTVSAHASAISGAVAAGDGCDIDIRGSRYDTSSVTRTGSGTIESVEDALPWVGTPAPLHHYACDDTTAALVDTGSSPVNLAFLGAGTPYSLADADGNWLWTNGKKSLVLAPATHADYFGADIADIPANSSLTMLCTLRPKGGANLGDAYQVVFSVSNGTSTDNAYILVTTSVGVLSAYGGVWVGGAGTNTAAKSIEPGERVTLGLSVTDGGVIQFWINGVLQDPASPTAFGGHLAAMTRIAVGGFTDGVVQHSYAGRIGEVQIYNRVLTGDEHRQYYAGTLRL